VNLFDELLDLLLPCRCALCGATGSIICEACVGELQPSERAVERSNIHGWAASSYGVTEMALIKAFKEDGLTALSGYLASAMKLAYAGLQSDAPTLLDGSLLVPAPSSRANFRKRGYLPSLLLARRLNHFLGRPLIVKDALKFVRPVEDQASLTVNQRKTNLSGSMLASSVVFGQRVILLDDVVTTGSTLAESARAIGQAGGEVVGFLTFSETILKTPAKF
jgi:predicted amidophosphoribosyltransferase